MNSIQVSGISKAYGPVQALAGIDLEVRRGELFGLIGPDGAGKTTLFRILTTLIRADGGTATVEDLDVIRDYRAIRRIVGYMPGRFSLYQDLTVRENLHFFATIFKTTVASNYALIRDIYHQLEPFESRRAGALSGGMKQKLALCCALIHRPRVLFLDEPTTGVDAVSRKEFWQMLHRLRDQGITIFVSTPYMDEATLCDRIALIQQGRLLSVGTPRQLVDAFERELWAFRGDDMYGLLQVLKAHPQVERAYAFGEAHHVLLRDDSAAESLLVDLRKQDMGQVTAVRTSPTIEDCFIDMMTKPALA